MVQCTKPLQRNPAKIFSASARLTPGTRARSSMLAACTPLRPPKCASSACRFGADTGDLLQ
jgi:hypothetical protein